MLTFKRGDVASKWRRTFKGDYVWLCMFPSILIEYFYVNVIHNSISNRFCEKKIDIIFLYLFSKKICIVSNFY